MHDRTYGLLKEARARWRDFDDASRKDPGMYERFRRNNRETSKKYSKFFLEQNDRIMAGKRAVAGDFEAAKKQKAVERLGIKLNLSPRAEAIYRKSLNGLSPREIDNIRTINNANFEQAAKESDFRKAETERLKNFVNAGKKENVSAIEGEVSKVQEAAKKGFRPTRKQLALAGGIAAGTAALGGAAYAGKKLYDRHKRKAEEQAEKAAAYYGESQHEKQAYTVEGDRIYLDKDDVTTLHYGVKDKIKDFAKGPAKDFIKGPVKDFIKGPAKKGVLTAASIVGPPAAIVGAAYGVDKLYQKRLNKKRKEYYARKRAMRQAAKEEQAEKAAAYYDEAQYAKEAALADYNEACAYEEAALTILDELGYLD